MKFNLTVAGIPELQRDLRRWNDTVRGKLQREIETTAAKIQREATEEAPSDTGKLRQGIIMMSGNLTAMVKSQRDYSVDIERGRGPTPTTARDLVGWVRRKFKLKGGHMWAVATIIAKKISAFGTRAQPFFEPAVERQRIPFFEKIRRIIIQTKA